MDKLIDLLTKYFNGDLAREEEVMREIRSWVGEYLEYDFYNDCLDSIRRIDCLDGQSIANSLVLMTNYREKCLKQMGGYRRLSL